MKAHAAQVGGNTVITLDAGDTITLTGVALSSLSAANFTFFTGAPADSITITGVPADAMLSAGTNNGGGSWTLTAAQLSGLTLTAGEVTTANLTITATNTQGAGASTTQTIALTVDPVAPALTAPSSLSVKEDGAVALGISETAFDSRDLVSITIAGVPADATLSAGSKGSNGIWTLSPGQLSGLTLTAGEVTTANLTITATNTQGAVPPPRRPSR